MNKKILFSFVLLSFIFLPIAVFAQTAGVNPMVKKIEEAFTSVAVSIIVIGWVIAGILYLMAMGNPTKIETAKKALTACVIGTALIVLATAAESMVKFYLLQ